MATNTEVNVRINVDAKGADNSVGSIKKQLREATAELIAMRDKFGDTSQEAVDAAKRVAELKDNIGDAKAMSDAFNPDAKFKALGSAIQAVAGGFAAVQGAQALFGSESEDVAKTLAKVQGALALTQGINSIMEAKDAFKNLGSVATEAFNKIKGAIGSTGIGLLVVALGTLAAYWDDITSAIGRTNDKQKALNETFDAYKKAATDATETTMNVKVAFDLAKQGVISKEEALKKYNETLGDAYGSAKDLNEAEKIFNEKTDAYIQSTALRAQADALMKKAAEENVKTIELRIAKEQLQSEGLGRFTKGMDEQNVAIQKNVSVYQDAAKDLIKQSEELNAKYKINDADQIKTNKETNDAIKKTAEEAAAKAKELRDKELERIKQFNEQKKQLNQQYANETKKLSEELELINIKDEDARAKRRLEIDYENKRKEIQNSIAGETEKNALLRNLKLKFGADIQAIDDAAADKKRIADAEKAQKAIDFENETFDLLEQNRINRIQDANQKSFEQEANRYQNEIDALYQQLNKKEITEDEFRKRREALGKIHEDNVTKIQDDADANRVANRKQKLNEEIDAISNAANSLGGILQQSYSNQLAQLEENSQQRIKAAGNNKDAITQIEQETAIQRNKIQNEEVKRQKIFAIAEALINTYKAGAQVFARPALGDPATSLAIKISTMIAAVAAGVKNVMAIRKVPMPSGGSGGTGGGGGETIQGINAPLPPALSQTMLNQGQINQLSSATARAFVLESDVSGNQERIQRLNRAARIS